MALRLESTTDTSATVWASAELKLGGTSLLLNVRKVLMKEREIWRKCCRGSIWLGVSSAQALGLPHAVMWLKQRNRLSRGSWWKSKKDHVRRTTWGVLVLSHSLQEDAFASEDSFPARVSSSAQSAVGCEELIHHFSCCLSKRWFSKHCPHHLTVPDWGGSYKLPPIWDTEADCCRDRL